MNTRLYNARILTMEKGKDIFFGEIAITDGKIVYVGEKEGMPALSWDEEIDCEENLLMPGFKNAHTHSAMTLLRSYADDVPLDVWLNEKIFPVEARLSGEDMYHLTKLAILEYVTCGVTGIFDMYLSPEDTAKACMEMGMRLVLVSGMNNFCSSVEKQEEEYLKWNNTHPLVTYRLGCHAEYTCSKELLQNLATLAHKYKAPVYMHLAETAGEVQGCKERHGVTPAVFFESLGLFDFGGGGYHCVHMTEDDYAVFQRRRLYAITNPASNAKLASGIAPIKMYLDKKIPVAIGTDGPASNNCLDMFREMFLVAGLSNLLTQDAASIPTMEILNMATVNGAHAMGLKDCDVLAPGKNADIILIDLKQPNMQPIHNIAKNIVYSGSKTNVAMTMVGGKVLYRNGEFFMGNKPEEIYEACENIAKKIGLK